MSYPTKKRPTSTLARKTAGVALAAGLTVLALGRPAHACWWNPIVFDPQALVQNVKQVAQAMQQVRLTADHIRNQLSALAHLDDSVAPDVHGTVAEVRSRLDDGLYETFNPAVQLRDRFPIDFASISRDQYQALQATWAETGRAALTENREVENETYRQMSDTTEQVRRIVEASNAAPGETAAVQAHNDLLAVLSGELSKLQALRVARGRAKVDRLARGQSELAYAQAERARVRRGWDTAPAPTSAVDDPFQYARQD